MTHERFLLFTHTIESFHKTIQRIKNGYASFFSVKSIHLFWLCELLKSPEGLTPSMLAKEVSIDRSLVSREMRLCRIRAYSQEKLQYSYKAYGKRQACRTADQRRSARNTGSGRQRYKR